MQTTYAFILIGGGLAGQSLIYHLLQGPLRGKRIALIDLEPKTSNDRTWCFWEQTPGPFEDIVCQRWDRLDFFSPSFSQTLDISPYTYKMIRGADFYQFVENALAAAPSVDRIYGKVQGWKTNPEGVEVLLEDGRTIKGNWGFSSLPSRPIDRARYHYMDQHFKGWVIRTEAPTFDPTAATFMDFRVPQEHGLSFLYALPVDTHRALVELTFFSNKLFTSEEYDAQLRALIPEFVTTQPYEVEHTEMGAIPMTDFPFPRSEGRIVYIGTAGGHTKPSSGYTFWRLQKNLLRLVRQLEETGAPFPLPAIAPARYGLFDSTLLNVLDGGALSAGDLFADLFRHNPPARVLKFLNEETSWTEDLQIMASVPTAPFLKAFLGEMKKKIISPTPGSF